MSKEQPSVDRQSRYLDLVPITQENLSENEFTQEARSEVKMSDEVLELYLKEDPSESGPILTQSGASVPEVVLAWSAVLLFNGTMLDFTNQV